MKPNVIVALLVGLVIGFAVAKVVSAPPAPVSIAGVDGTDQSKFKIKSTDFPAEMFAGLTDSQQWAVMKVMNDNICDCGCGFGSLANCRLKDPHCPNSPKKFTQAIALARQGKTSDQIQLEMFKKAAPGSNAGTAAVARGPQIDTTVYKVPVDGSPSKGPADALVTIVEFSDYQCPFCARADGTLQQLEQQYEGKLRFVMKQLPLDNLHPQARGGALAALAAGKQGKYWEMHKVLFQNMRKMDDASLQEYARELGLDLKRFNADRASDALKKQVAGDEALARSLGITGTPGFFINGRKLNGALPLDTFKKVIDEELVKAEALVKAGTPAREVYAKIIADGRTAPVAAAPSAAPAAAAPAQFAKVDAPADSPSFGPANAKVTIVEWSDFQCPFCARALPVLKQLKEAYPKDVRVVFRHLPLHRIHPQAQLAAEASMAAHEQGKFWEYHDKLFENQRQLGREHLEKYAQDLGLNMGKFRAALDSGKYKAKVDADTAAATSAGASGTPTFFINGRKQVGVGSFEAWKSIIDSEIAKADKLLASGVRPDKLYQRILEENSATPKVTIDTSRAPTRGPKNAPVQIVAFSDFECPFCSRAVPTLEQIEKQYGDKVQIAFKHQPLSMHKNARLAAIASMAAHEQGKFWEYHDKLFANQRQLDRGSLERYAEELRLDMTKFRAALDSGKYDAVVNADMAEAARMGVTGTPTFFINGQQLVGADPNRFKQIVEAELKKTQR